jgi:hypothetical protein
MIEFENLNLDLQEQFQDLVIGDPWNLKPMTLYKNVVGSLSLCKNEDCVQRVAQIFEIPTYLTKEIYRINFE